jgi:gluconokinase
MQRPHFFVLTFDIGTSSLRTALFDSAARRIEGATHQVEYQLAYGHDGRAELSCRTLLAAAKSCLAATLQAYRAMPASARPPIRAVGVSCFWHSLLGTGVSGGPITPIYTWADSRCQPEAVRLRAELAERAVHRRTGCMLRASYWPAKLCWLRRTDPKLFKSVHRWLSPAEWLGRELGGPEECSVSMASGTGLLDVQTLRWDEELVARCHLRAGALNTLGEERAGPSQKRAGLAPELRGARWFSAIGDGAASNLGSGATHPGVAALNVGTSAALRIVVSGQPEAPFGLFRYRVDADRYLIGGAISNAGNLRAWCVRELRLEEDGLERALAARPAPQHGLDVRPFWTAERAPDWEEDMHGAVSGITQRTTALDILQAATEATYFRLARIAGLLFPANAQKPALIVSGGVQHSPSSLRRLANILDQPVHPNDEPEASLRGAAIYALERLGEPLRPDPLPRRRILPNPALVQEYALARTRAEAAVA